MTQPLLAIQFKKGFGQLLPYLVSNKKILNLRKDQEFNGYASCDLQDFIGTIYEEQARKELVDILFHIDDKGQLIIFGNTYYKKDYLKYIGFKWGGYSPLPHWKQEYSESLAQTLNMKYNLSIPMLKDPKVVLDVKGSTVYVLNGKKHIHKSIDSFMRYQPLGYEFSIKYRNGTWDGWITLFDWKNKSFPIGFLNYAKKVLDSTSVDYEVKDNRTRKTYINLEMTGVTLRDYQLETVEHCFKEEMAFVSSPTGTGKTEIAMGIINKIKAKTLIVVHTNELLNQWKRRLENRFNIEVGIIGGSKFEERDITIAMVQTAHRKIPKNNYDVLIVDEAHHSPADTFYKLAGKVSAMYRFGLSATPFREDGEEIKFFAYLGSLYQSIEVSEAIERGFLVKPEFQFIEGSKAYAYNWKTEIKQACEDELTNQNIVSKAIELMNEDHFVYVDVRRIEHGNILTRMFEDLNVDVDFIHGRHSSDTREQTLRKFAEGKRVLVSTLIKEGVDLPEMSAIILAGPTKSFSENIQKIGRVLRIKPNGTNKAIVVDRMDKGKYTKTWFDDRQKFLEKYYN